MLVLNENTIAGGSPGHGRKQALPLHAIERLDARALKHGRRNVDRRGERSAARQVILCLRIGPDEGYPHDALVLLRSLEQQAMIAEVVAVIAGEDEDCAFLAITALERQQYLADRIVDAADHPAGERACLLGFARRYSN